MSNLSDLLAPAASPAVPERPAPKPAEDTRRSAAEDGPRFADELERERAADRDRASERAADRERAAERAADQNQAADRAAERDRATEQSSNQDRAAKQTTEQDQTTGQNNEGEAERTEASTQATSSDTDIVETPASDPIQPDIPSPSETAELAIEPTGDGTVETPTVAPQTGQTVAKTLAPEESGLVNPLADGTEASPNPETTPGLIRDTSETAPRDETANPDVIITDPTDETITVPSAAAASAPEQGKADAAEVIKVTALSGETVPLTPPPFRINTQAEPGALGRWFAQAAGPIALDGSPLQTNGLLNKLSTQTSQQALNSGQPASQEADLAAFRQGGAPSTTAPEMTFADAMATSSMDSESLDALVTQAITKANAALEPGTPTTPAMTAGQNVATGAQAAVTAVPQAATGQAVPVTALAVEITRQAANGKTQFDIRLDPPELGRLNVRLEMDASGQTRTHLVVERAETLDMLSSDARSLERALQQAGLKSEPGSVSFELAQDAADGFDQDSQRAGTDDQGDGQPTEAAGSDAAPDAELSDQPLDAITSPEAIRQQLAVTGHLDVHV